MSVGAGDEGDALTTPEAVARVTIDSALEAAGWQVQDVHHINLHAGPGVAVREFPLPGHGFADYLTLRRRKRHRRGGGQGGWHDVDWRRTAGGEVQRGTAARRARLRATVALPVSDHRHRNPLHEPTHAEPRSRRVFTFHRPETLAGWIDGVASNVTPIHQNGQLAAEEGCPIWQGQPARSTAPDAAAQSRPASGPPRSPPCKIWRSRWPTTGPRALIQMATGAGKTFTAITSVYRLIKFGGAKRILFLVDRATSASRPRRSSDQYRTPDDGRKFTELYNVQRLTSNTIDPVASVCITTIQRLYSMLQGEQVR